MIYLYYITIIFIVSPIFEWGAHYMLHYFNEIIHKKHHLEYHNGSVSIEKCPIPVMMLLIYFKQYFILFIYFKYYFIHNIIHKYPVFFRFILRYRS